MNSFLLVSGSSTLSFLASTSAYQERPKVEHSLDSDPMPNPPNMDGSDRISVVKSPNPSKKSCWRSLLRIALILVVVLTLVTILNSSEIARPRDRCALEIQGYEQKRTKLQKEIQVLVATKEKLLAEKAKLDKWSTKLEVERQQIRWINDTDVGCSAYAKRRYTAFLSNVAPGLDPAKECLKKALRINGRPMAPTKCEFSAHPPNTPEIFSGRMIGVWDVDAEKCKVRVAKHEDEGCYRPGGRHYKGIIKNVRDHENFLKVCYTMPGGVVHKHKGHPLSLGEPEHCQSECNTAKQLFGGKCNYWARWSVADPACP